MQTTEDHTTSDLLPSTSDYVDTAATETDPNYRLAMTLLRTVIPMIVLMGTVGNALSFCVLVRRRMRSTPMYFYLTLLAVADTVVLYVSALKVWIRAVTHFEVLHLSNVGCKLFMFILLCSFYMSAWLVVLVTLDRFLVVWFPFRGYLFMRIHRARLTAAVLAIIVAVYNVHVFWTMSLHQYGSAPTCDAAEDNFFMTHIFEYLKLISYCVVPFIVVIALNIGILFRINRVYANAATRREGGLRDAAAVYRHQTPMVVVGPSSPPLYDNADEAEGGVVWPQRQQFALSAATSTNRHQSSVNIQKLRQRRLTKMLLFISFAWLALTAPFTLHSFLPEPLASLTSSSFYSSLSSSPTTTNFSKSTSSMSTSPTVSQLVKSDRFLYHTDQEILESTFNSEHFHETATESFLAEDPNTYTSSTSVSTSSPPASVDPSRYLLVKTICFLLMYLNHAINFYLYCLTGKRFRKELAAMLNCGGLWLMCSAGADETVAAAGGGGGGGVMCEMAVLNGRREVNQNQQLAEFVPVSHPQPSSSSSRTCYGRVVNPVRRSSSELNNERFS